MRAAPDGTGWAAASSCGTPLRRCARGFARAPIRGVSVGAAIRGSSRSVDDRRRPTRYRPTWTHLDRTPRLGGTAVSVRVRITLAMLLCGLALAASGGVAQGAVEVNERQRFVLNETTCTGELVSLDVTVHFV